jgi:hypothetical protein
VTVTAVDFWNRSTIGTTCVSDYHLQRVTVPELLGNRHDSSVGHDEEARYMNLLTAASGQPTSVTVRVPGGVWTRKPAEIVASGLRRVPATAALREGSPTQLPTDLGTTSYCFRTSR